MNKLFVIDPHDQALFRQAAGSVKPLFCDRINPIPTHHAVPVPRISISDSQQTLSDMISDCFEPKDSEMSEKLYYRRCGVQHAILRKLRRGQFHICAVLDLHGMTVTAARTALVAFLLSIHRARFSCVRIIHGKGNGSRQQWPVLKQKLNNWLRQRDDVLAFCSARSWDGGTGAVYVLLRHQK
jgi:DNA-nicking Smr family endonuclease